MQYRKNHKNNDELSALGFGCMRFPEKGFKIDEKESEALILRAIEEGINYFDTAYIYHYGKSEGFLGDVLHRHHLRDQVYLATKLPHYRVQGAEDFDKFLSTQLERLKTSYIDYYLIHMLPDRASFDRLLNLGLIEWIAQKKEEGKIRNIGFSFHGKGEEFLKLVDAYPWDFCQIQYNYLDTHNQAGTRGLKYAHKKGLPIIVMEPLRGGRLVSHLPKEAEALLQQKVPGKSPARFALEFIWDLPEVTLVLSGMRSEKDLLENVATAKEALPMVLEEDQKTLYGEVKAILNQSIKVPCTACGYCMPCPFGVDIATCFNEYNEKYTLKTGKAWLYYIQNTAAFTKNPGYASLCKSCKQCESHCPQSIAISEELGHVAKDMEKFWFLPAIRLTRRFFYKNNK